MVKKYSFASSENNPSIINPQDLSDEAVAGSSQTPPSSQAGSSQTTLSSQADQSGILHSPTKQENSK